jgi:putative ABC transport system substrate-binding protein
VPGASIRIEYRYAEGEIERLPALAAELVALPVDVLVARAPQAIRAAQRATTTIPIVMIGAGDPITTKLVASLARPGGSITGSSQMGAELSARRL